MIFFFITAIFDVYCEGENGEKFIVEMQNAYQTYFKDCALFYSTFPIREQAQKIRHHVQLCDTATHKVFYDKLEYIYVEISKFNKPLEGWHPAASLYPRAEGQGGG